MGSAKYTINLPAAQPAFSVAAGTYTSVQTVTLSDTTPNATIYYTTNGTTPTASSTKYTAAITVSSTETIKAIAAASGYTNSTVASAAYTINLPAAAPTFSPAGGSYTATQTVTISSKTTGATIYYTTDGTTPTANSTKYTAAIKVTSAETINAIATATNYSVSPMSSASYTITLPAATPTFSPAAGTYTSIQTVAISSSTSGATIYYTADGTTPTASSTPYTGSIKVSATETINAIATASGYSTSTMGSAKYTINLPVTAPTVTLTTITGITQTTATSGGNVTSDGNATVTARGVAWGASANPTTSGTKTTDGSGTGSYTSSLTGLTRGTTYHVRAYATNSKGTSYSSDTTFATITAIPVVTTTSVSSITNTTAASGGNVSDDGGSTVTARGVVWGTSANPTTANSKTTNGTGTGSYTSSLTGLTSGAAYHVRAYATNSIGTAYGADVAFTTTSPFAAPSVTTVAPTSIQKTAAVVGGNVTSDGGQTVTERGVVWGLNNPPTLSDNKITASGTTGSFSVNLSGLTVKTVYYVRAYATNSAGTGYGSVATFETLNNYGLPASVAPLITNRWLDYTWPYNAYYPRLNGNGIIGQATCGPTALAKTLGYWKQPNGNGQIDMTDTSGYHWVIDLSTMNVNTANLPDLLPATATDVQYHDVATLFLAAGATMDGIGESYVDDDFFPFAAPYLLFSPAVHVEHDWEYTADDWVHLVEYELAHGRPLMVAGRTPVSPEPWEPGNYDGHYWNVDGYNDQDQIHATYNYVDSSGNPIAGYFPVASMGPVTTDSGANQGYSKTHDVAFDLQPLIPATSDPVVETEPANNPTLTTVRLSGSVVGEGNSSVTSRGFHIVAVSGATTQPYDVIAGSGAGHFITTLTGLTPAATYTVTAFGSTGSQTFYGETQQFTTLAAGAVPDAVMPLLPTDWKLNTWPYNADLPAFSPGPGGYWYNEPYATALARILDYWRYPTNGTGVFTTNNVDWTGVNLQVDLSKLNLDYTQMPIQLASTATSAQYGQIATLMAATETFGRGNASGQGNMHAADPDAYIAPALIAAWGLDSGLQMVKQESVTADQWAQLLKTEIAAGRPVLIQGRTSDSPAPGGTGNVNSGWFLVDGYNASGQFHADYSGFPLNVGIPKGWFTAATLGPPDGFIAYNRAFIGFKPGNPSAGLPTVTTAPASNVSSNSVIAAGTATGNGNRAITDRGFVWATHTGPTTADSTVSDGAGDGSFTSSIPGLVRNSVYYLRAYGTSSSGTAYGSEVTFTTLSQLPTVITAAVSNVASATATSGGNVTDDGGGTITARGVAWSSTANPTISNSKTVDGSGTGTYSSSLTGLTDTTAYHVRAYATNSGGTAYGADIAFTTTIAPDVPTVTSATPTSIQKTSAVMGGTVTSDGGKTITERGIVWGVNNPPSIADNKVTASGTTGSFTLTLTGLTGKTVYYARAYATNSAGTGYGAPMTVATLNQYGLPAAVPPLITNRWLDFTWPYNAYYPSVDGVIRQAECGPTALAKLLGYWKQPNGNGTIDQTDVLWDHWVIDLSHMNIDFSKVYDELSPTATQAQYDQTAKLFLAAGAVADTNNIGNGINYGDDFFLTIGSYLNISPAVHAAHDLEYTADDWVHLVEYELAHGRPLIVAGRSPGDPEPWESGNINGHWWNVDGYNEQDQIHATYNYLDSSGNPIGGYFPVYSMGPVTVDSGVWPGFTEAHDVAFDFQPVIPATSDPVVETEPANSPTSTTVRVSGSAVGEGNSKVTSRGFHVVVVSGAGTQPYDVVVGSGAGHFITTLTGLSPAATYTVTAFGSTGSQTFYGDAQEFTTLASGAVPDEVMPLLPTDWKVGTWPYNADLPLFWYAADGSWVNWYNEDYATALARILDYWRYPTNGTGVFAANNVEGTDVNLHVDLSTLNLDYTQMPYRLSSTASPSDYAQIATLMAATEIFGFGATNTGAGAMRAGDLDAYVAPAIVAAWGLDSGLQMVKQEAVSADAWAAMLKAEIAAGRPVLIQGRTSDSVAPGQQGGVNSGWFLVDGYNASGQFHVDYSWVSSYVMPVAKGWFSPSALGPSDGGYIAYNRAFIGFRPK